MKRDPHGELVSALRSLWEIGDNDWEPDELNFLPPSMFPAVEAEVSRLQYTKHKLLLGTANRSACLLLPKLPNDKDFVPLLTAQWNFTNGYNRGGFRTYFVHPKISMNDSQVYVLRWEDAGAAAPKSHQHVQVCTASGTNRPDDIFPGIQILDSSLIPQSDPHTILPCAGEPIDILLCLIGSLYRADSEAFRKVIPRNPKAATIKLLEHLKGK